MLWDVIYEFFIKYIFGGHINGLTYAATIGDYFDNSGNASNGNTNYFSAYKFTSITGYEFTLSLGNYLSLIATIISIVVIVLLCCMLIKKIYNICAHVIG